MQKKEFMLEAIQEAKNAKGLGDLPFGAIIVCDGKIVGRGKCENGTGGDVTAHAEINALREACKNLGRNKLNDCTIYCTNEPCPMCSAALFQAKIANLVIALRREDLGNFFRARNIQMQELADDSGFEINSEFGFMKEHAYKQFEDIIT